MYIAMKQFSAKRGVKIFSRDSEGKREVTRWSRNEKTQEGLRNPFPFSGI